jgi:hypothetical protein
VRRRVYLSFHYARDSQRVSQVRQMGAVQGQRLLSANSWEEVRRGGSFAIRRWIGTQMRGKSCIVVLIGTHTSERKWVNYEIRRAWKEGRGVLGIHIHGLLNLDGRRSAKGSNPFYGLKVKSVNQRLSSIAKTYDPPFSTSKLIYGHIAANLGDWVEEAIEIRNRFP